MFNVNNVDYVITSSDILFFPFLFFVLLKLTICRVVYKIHECIWMSMPFHQRVAPMSPRTRILLKSKILRHRAAIRTLAHPVQSTLQQLKAVAEADQGVTLTTAPPQPAAVPEATLTRVPELDQADPAFTLSAPKQRVCWWMMFAFWWLSIYLWL